LGSGNLDLRTSDTKRAHIIILGTSC
jgi:hypothetical protein